jgi:hypothetical protein
MYTLNYVFSAAKIGVRMQETVTVIDRGSDPRRLNPRLSLRFVGSNQRCLSHLSRKAQFYEAVEEHSYNQGQKQKGATGIVGVDRSNLLGKSVWSTGSSGQTCPEDGWQAHAFHLNQKKADQR